MIKTIKSANCDHCEKVQEYEDARYFGGHPLSGWLLVKMHGGPTDVDSLKAQHDWLFCSKKCLVEHFTRKDQTHDH